MPDGLILTPLAQPLHIFPRCLKMLKVVFLSLQHFNVYLCILVYTMCQADMPQSSYLNVLHNKLCQEMISATVQYINTYISFAHIHTTNYI